MRWLGGVAGSLALLSTLAACQPSARRLLLLDLNLADPLVLEATAAPWHGAGYRIEYRRYYPHLTRADLARYRTVVILGGREPQGLSDALTLGDLSILNEWVGGSRNGVVVLVYTSDRRNPAGTLDRWAMNHWLASQGAGIAIGSEPQDDPALPLPRSSLDNAGFAPFPAGRNQTLLVRNPTQVLARAPSGALVAAARVNEGLIVVAGRDFLASADEDPRTRDYLVALARWTRRPAEWAGVGAAASGSPLRLAGAPRPVAQRPPPLVPPAGARVIELPQPATLDVTDKSAVPGWIARQGMRGFWSRFTYPSFDSVLRFVDIASLNALASVIPVQAIADTVSTRNLWRLTIERLQTTNLHWFPAVALTDIRSETVAEVDRRRNPRPVAEVEVDRHGNPRPVPCGLDSLFWRGALRSTYRTLARLGGTTGRVDVIAGVAVDLDSALIYYGGTGFCDTDYRTGLVALGLERDERLATLPPALRYDTLLERGYLGRYFDALRAATAERARVLSTELRRLRPDLRFAFRSDEVPEDWFSLGLLQGFSTADSPVLVWLRQPPTGELLARYRERGIYAISALRLEPERNTFVPSGWNRLRPVVFGEHSGFWLDRAPPDSIARLIRRITR